MGIKEIIAELTGADQFFEVEQREYNGRSYKAFKHASTGLTEIIQNGRGHGDADFLIAGDQRLTFNGFYAQVDRFLGYLQSHGFEPGERFAIAMRNQPEWLVAYAAATLAGAIVVPINSWGQRDELLFALEDSGATWLVCDDRRGRAVEDVLPTERRFISYDELDAETVRGIPLAVALDGAALGQPHPADFDDDCLLLYTSGSTGAPKGVLHAQHAIAQAMFNMMFTGMLAMTVEGARELQGGATQEKTLLTVPLFHGTGLLGSFVLPLMMGSAVVMMRKWDAQEALRLIERERITLFSSVPSLVKDLLTQPNIEDFDIECLQRVSSGGAAMPSDLPALVASRVTNPSNSGGYGMTETLAVGSQASGAVFDPKPSSSGVKSPIMDLRFVDQSGTVLSPGQVGEIEMRGITVTPGYWGKPEANAKIFSGDGWMKSGDLGYIDEDNYLYITGRIKEIVIRGGENIYPGDTEQACYQVDGVQECVVFGVPDEKLGEELVAVIYRIDVALDEAALRAALADKLAAYKIPKFIEFRDVPLPRGATEKLDKRGIRDQYLASLTV